MITGTPRIPARRTLASLCLAGLAALHVVPVAANGHLFFGEGAAARELNGAPFFGFVRDRAGRGIAEAQVTIESAEAQTRLVVQTDALGHYFFAGFRPEIDPRKVALSCSKSGYRFVRKVPRPPIGQVTDKTPIEINCLLEKDAG